VHTSLYTIYVKLPDSLEWLLVHGYTGAIDLVQENVVQFLKSYYVKASAKATLRKRCGELCRVRGFPLRTHMMKRGGAFQRKSRTV